MHGQFVATTMAVLMKYNQWPAQGFGAHAYDCQGYGTQTANFAATTYDLPQCPIPLPQLTLLLLL
jgi:hypothetical protein